ncbi:MAG: FIST C-terminal domain-containing protein [Proteobacteria bacterium]|nr:FIST C-terminal domain-containing protein [Pseudomonadota bacterium]
MEIRQYCWDNTFGWDQDPGVEGTLQGDLMLIFGATRVITDTDCIVRLRAAFPNALMIGCSTAGEIVGTHVSDNRLIATVIAFHKTAVVGACVSTHDYPNSFEAAKALVGLIPCQGLRHLFVLADGILTNGSEVVRGLNELLPVEISVTGGLAGDGMEFKNSYIVFDGQVCTSSIVAVGFYGDHLRIGFGSSGGWVPFGPERLITKSQDNILSELDGQSALALYKKYLGRFADQLPGAGLLFPLSIFPEDSEDAFVRTITHVDEKNDYLGFAGDVPNGCYARFMRAVPDDLIDGAEKAAAISKSLGGESPELCILISCVGRKAVLKQLTEEETEGVQESYRNKPVMTGFYSYGEIAPFRPGERAILHNQTMTITTISED